MHQPDADASDSIELASDDTVGPNSESPRTPDAGAFSFCLKACKLAALPIVTLEAASIADAPLLSNLLSLYVHDLSAAFPSVELGPDGRFGYEKLALYWSEPEQRFPFLIRYDARVAGFAFATRGSPASVDPSVFDVAEFFVLRQYRRSGVGQRAADLLWNRLPGAWIVRVSEGPPGALPFWTNVIAEFTTGAATVSKRTGKPHDWHVFSFTSTR